jgi:hypothetical protein
VVQAAVSIQAVALGLGLVSWLGAVGAHVRQGVWFIFIATDLAVVAAALIFAVAVLRSRELRPLAPQLKNVVDDDEGPGDRSAVRGVTLARLTEPIVSGSQGIDPAGHLPTEKVGCQKLSGQRRIEMKY